MQDLGRPGHRARGIAPAGPFDVFAHRAANALVANPETAAALEVTLTGPRLAALADATIAVTGADLDPAVDGRPVPLWRTLLIRKGQVLGFGRRRTGFRAAVAVAGGLAGPEFLGSRATDLRSGLGGRRLATGDLLAAGPAAAVIPERDLAARAAPVYRPAGVLRVLPGPEPEWFPREAAAVLAAGPWTIHPASDRTGCRLAGPALPRRAGDLLSVPVLGGDIQVPPDGRPIILGPECQSVGGYPRLACVITADLPKLAQAMLGEPLRFVPVEFQEAVTFASALSSLLSAAV